MSLSAGAACFMSGRKQSSRHQGRQEAFKHTIETTCNASVEIVDKVKERSCKFEYGRVQRPYLFA
eukprot:6199821-Pleurochrysis_carterae.AAC.2